MKVFVTGVCGQLGHDVVNELIGRGCEAVGSDITEKYSGADDGSAVVSAPYEQLDITDSKAVTSVLTRINPDSVIHCAAWTAVDAAEDEENKAKVYAINADGTRNIAKACKELDCKIIYISTDYVFDGEGVEPWQPDCRDYAPLCVYGDSKLKGELAVRELTDKYFIVRIAWVFGKNGNNFIKTMLRVGRNLAKLLADMCPSERYGCYHATNEGGYISWYDFTKEIYKQAGYKTNLVPVTTEEYGLSKAKRPHNSRLDKSKLTENGFALLPTWQDALSRYLKEIKY